MKIKIIGIREEMKKMKSSQWRTYIRGDGLHILVISWRMRPLFFNACLLFHVKSELVRSFADQVNRRDEPGTLHPKAPITAFPYRFFRDFDGFENSDMEREFREQLSSFLEINDSTIEAHKLLVNFRDSQNMVPRHIVDATIDVLNTSAHVRTIEQVHIGR